MDVRAPLAIPFRIALASAIALAMSVAMMPASAAPTHGDAPPPVAGGIWKAATPAHRMHGEFDNFDPMGLAAGAKIEADCSLNWTDPDTGRLYCFASGTSLVYFLQRPHANINDARAAWIGMQRRDAAH